MLLVGHTKFFFSSLVYEVLVPLSEETPADLDHLSAAVAVVAAVAAQHRVVLLHLGEDPPEQDGGASEAT